jgi:hypothetical protein
MRVFWEVKDINPGRRYSKEGNSEVWIIGYISNISGPEGQKIKSARKNLRRLMSLPILGAANRLRIEGLKESISITEIESERHAFHGRTNAEIACSELARSIRSRIAELEKGEG